MEYYRLELNDCATPAFVSGGKYYCGTMDDIRSFISAIESDENTRDRLSKVIEAFHAYDCGNHSVMHAVAYRDVPFLVPMRLLHKIEYKELNRQWEHLNTWGWPYYMRCSEVISEHLWLKCDTGYFRAVQANFQNLQYKGSLDIWDSATGGFWGVPHMLTVDQSIVSCKLAVPEKYFKTLKAAKDDWEAFTKAPDPDYTEFCNEVFGDG